MGVDDCPVQFDAPPPKLDFGALEIMDEKPPLPPVKVPSKDSKKKKKKPPKSVRFPYSERTESAERFIEAGLGPGNKMGRLRVGYEPLLFPGWLIQLTDDTLNTLMNIKNILSSGKSFCEVLEEVILAVGSIGVGVSESDIVEVLRRTPYMNEKWSFSHFLMGLGNPSLAREKGVFQPPMAVTGKYCRDLADGDMPDKDNKEETPGVRTFKTQQEYTQRLFDPYNLGKEDHWPARRKTETVEEETDITGYSMREKIFYSGLLIFEMYATMSALEDLYFQSESIPVPRDKFLKLQARRGFGVENIGTRKPKFAEWDRPLPPAHKQSPYLDSFPLVATRWKIQKPNIEEKTRKHSTARLQPLHLLVSAPKFERPTVKVTENRDRIKKAMDYLASTGNCVAMLPNAHYIIHLSDTFLQKLEEINMNAVTPPVPPKYSADNDMSDILHEASKLYLPHGIPCQIARMKFMLPYHCAISLRKICEHVRMQHWEYIDQQYKEFRDIAWNLMRVGQIPCGQLRKNFIYAFDTYLPERAWLPMGYSCTNNPWD